MPPDGCTPGTDLPEVTVCAWVNSGRCASATAGARTGSIAAAAWPASGASQWPMEAVSSRPLPTSARILPLVQAWLGEELRDPALRFSPTPPKQNKSYFANASSGSRCGDAH